MKKFLLVLMMVFVTISTSFAQEGFKYDKKGHIELSGCVTGKGSFKSNFYPTVIKDCGLDVNLEDCEELIPDDDTYFVLTNTLLKNDAEYVVMWNDEYIAITSYIKIINSKIEWREYHIYRRK